MTSPIRSSFSIVPVLCRPRKGSLLDALVKPVRFEPELKKWPLSQSSHSRTSLPRPRLRTEVRQLLSAGRDSPRWGLGRPDAGPRRSDPAEPLFSPGAFPARRAGARMAGARGAGARGAGARTAAHADPPCPAVAAPAAPSGGRAGCARLRRRGCPGPPGAPARARRHRPGVRAQGCAGAWRWALCCLGVFLNKITLKTSGFYRKDCANFPENHR